MQRTAKLPIKRPTVGIVGPAAAGANNGNRRTAERWARQLAPDFRTRLLTAWQGEPVDLLVVLHARRCAPSIAAWADFRDRTDTGVVKPLVVVLTGTDLYRDIHSSAAAQHSLRVADALVVLQDHGLRALPEAGRSKATVILQSTSRRRVQKKTTKHLRVIMAGHLRAEKFPQSLFAAARRLRDRSDIRIDHIGAALDPALGRQAARTALACPAYRWLGGLSHSTTLRWIQRAHVLVHTSRIEGGAHVVLEAICSGTPVLASDIDGNRGMLGPDYDGYFPFGDDSALARMLERCRDEPRWLAHLAGQCRARARLFAPSRERRALHALVHGMLAGPPRAPVPLQTGG
jgi:putative glycosyltransferase (TIGR04348 family)